MAAINNALVLGGGIGGLTAAIALQRQGIRAEVVEISPDWAVYGVGIIQPNNALRDLDRLGLARPCVEAGAPFVGWKVNDAMGNLLEEAPASNSAQPEYPPFNGIRRPILQKVLLDGARAAEVKMTWGIKATGLDDDGDAVAVKFSDGTAGRYDLVIGADGLYSPTRSWLFGDTYAPRYVGEGVWRYNFPKPPDFVWSSLYIGSNSKVGLVPLSDTIMYMLLVTAEPGNPRMPCDQLAALMRDRLAEYGGIVAEMREQITDPAAVVYKPLETLMITEPWHKGRVILIGDAAHAMCPHINQGAAVAVEDAVLLAELLGGDASLNRVLDEFMERRLARATYVQRSSGQIAEWELAQWSGFPDPAARPIELMQEVTSMMQEPY